jgi:hypothetical protein
VNARSLSFGLFSALLTLQIAGACATTPRATAQAPGGGDDRARRREDDRAPGGDGHLIAGKALTVTTSCGTPPYEQPARAVRIYRDGASGMEMVDPHYRS